MAGFAAHRWASSSPILQLLDVCEILDSLSDLPIFNECHSRKKGDTKVPHLDSINCKVHNTEIEPLGVELPQLWRGGGPSARPRCGECNNQFLASSVVSDRASIGRERLFHGFGLLEH